MISSSSNDSCSQVVAGNYDVIVNEPASFRTILTDYLDKFKQLESDLLVEKNKQQQQQQQQLLAQKQDLELQQQHQTQQDQPNQEQQLNQQHQDVQQISLQPQNSGYACEFKMLKEFSKLLKQDKANFLEGEQDYNQRKNRYRDIIPFSHTRVVLKDNPQIPGSDYINANYIKGPSGSPKAYIACQGPLRCTLIDFWRMIWECGVSVIIMACNENESDKPKCELYWPEQVGSSESYGNIQVTLVKVRQICPDFLIRKFSVKLVLQPNLQPPSNSAQDDEYTNNVSSCKDGNHVDNMTMKDNSDNSDSSTKQSNMPTGTNNNNIYIHNYNYNNNNNNNNIINDDEAEKNANKFDDNYQSNNLFPESKGVILERTICQFHYTTWPDHGAPDSIQPILDLVQLMRYVQPEEDKPILIHCSAGCGRTGTICCIDYVWGLLKQGKLDSSFDLCSIISEMRQQRMSMVQTLAQYVLCHRAVATLFVKQLKQM